MSGPGEHNVIVVGAGIAGLATAYYLQELARTAGARLACRLLESDQRLGGKILTDRPDGLIIEAGPDAFLTQKPWTYQLCQQLGLSGQLIGTNDRQRKTFIVRHGRLRELPEGILWMVPTQALPLLRSDLLSWRAKLRLGLELVAPKRTENGDESLAAFARRRFGREAFEHMLEPLMSGIYAGDAEQMSLKATFPRFIDLEQKYGSLIRGLMRQRQHAPPPANSPANPNDPRPTMFMTLQAGLVDLVDRLAARLDQVAIMTGSQVTGIRATAAGSATSGYTVQLLDGQSLDTDVVILATPAFVSAQVLAGLDRPLADKLRQIPYVSTATVSLAYRRSGFSHPLNGFGFVVPKVEQRQITACTWTSTKFPHRAPDDLVLLRCFVGRAGYEDVVWQDDPDLVQMCRDELRALMGIVEEPVLARVYRWERGMPQYLVGHLDWLEQLGQLLAAHPGLFLTGSAYRGIGLPDCVHAAAQTATQVLSYLKRDVG